MWTEESLCDILESLDWEGSSWLRFGQDRCLGKGGFV